jgi:hypothetical protein
LFHRGEVSTLLIAILLVALDWSTNDAQTPNGWQRGSTGFQIKNQVEMRPNGLLDASSATPISPDTCHNQPLMGCDFRHRDSASTLAAESSLQFPFQQKGNSAVSKVSHYICLEQCVH